MQLDIFGFRPLTGLLHDRQAMAVNTGLVLGLWPLCRGKILTGRVHQSKHFATLDARHFQWRASLNACAKAAAKYRMDQVKTGVRRGESVRPENETTSGPEQE